jgi:cytochrome c553
MASHSLSPKRKEQAAHAEWAVWPHVGWILFAGLPLLIVLIVWSPSAVAQTFRGEDTIKRVLALEPDVARGADLYLQRCANCHGPLGVGDAERVIPAIAGQLQGYVIKQLVDIAEGDRTVNEMHRTLARADLVSPQSIRDVAAFVTSLTPLRTPQRGDGKAVAHGGQLYLAQCAACHGKDARGMEAGPAPALRGQHYAYLVKQMRQAALGHRYGIDIEVIDSMEALMLPDLMAIADFLSRKTATDSAKVPLKPNGLSNESSFHKDLQ